MSMKIFRHVFVATQLFIFVPMVTKGIVFKVMCDLPIHYFGQVLIHVFIFRHFTVNRNEKAHIYIISKTVLSCMLDDQTRPICIVYLLCSFRNSNDDIFNINNHIFSNHRCILLQIEIFFNLFSKMQRGYRTISDIYLLRQHGYISPSM